MMVARKVIDNDTMLQLWHDSKNNSADNHDDEQYHLLRKLQS